MRKAIVALAVLAMAGTAFGGIGDWWILPIDRLDGNFTTHVGAGYDGTDAKEGNGIDGIRRVWWSTDNVYDSSGAALPSSAELFTIDVYGPTAGALDWQPVEVQYNGYTGDVYPIDPNIPWAGMFGTNHQYLGSSPAAGAWAQAGPGPQSPDSGSEIYAQDGSVFYAKWDFGWPINRSWSMIKITQTTPEPASALLLLLGAPLLRRKSR